MHFVQGSKQFLYILIFASDLTDSLIHLYFSTRLQNWGPNKQHYIPITYKKKDASGTTGYTQTELEPRMLSYPLVFIWIV